MQDARNHPRKGRRLEAEAGQHRSDKAPTDGERALQKRLIRLKCGLNARAVLILLSMDE